MAARWRPWPARFSPACVDGQPDPHFLQMLAWAARIREIGSFIAHADAHKHGGYIVANADLPGFSGGEQRLLALLVLGQSGGLRKLRSQEPTVDEWLLILVPADRGHPAAPAGRAADADPGSTPPSAAGPAGGWQHRACPGNGQAEHPLTDQSLQKEVAEWTAGGNVRQVGYTLT